MVDNFDLITEQPTLLNLILSGAWQDEFDQGQVEDAYDLLKKNAPLGFEIFEVEDEAVMLEASFFASSRRYHQAQVVFDLVDDQWTMPSRCSCKEGYSCFHTAALIMHTERLLQEHPNYKKFANLTNPAVSQWLRDINQLKKESTTKKSKPAKPSNQSIAYCLHLPDEYNPIPYLTLKLCKYTKKNGSVIDTYTNPTANPQQPARYMQTEDVFPCTLYHQLSRVHYSNQIELEGKQAGQLLDAAQKTKRLYFIENLSTYEQPANPISVGKTIQPKPTWLSQADGSTRPTLGLPKNSILIETDPLFVFNSKTLTLSPVSNKNYSSEFLIGWQNGPVIPAEKIEYIAPELAKIQLPKPKPLTNKTLEKSAPTPSLRLFRQNPFTHGGLHLSGQPEPIIAEITFTYHGHPFKPELSDDTEQPLQSFSLVHANQILKIPRDNLKEIDYIKELIEGGKITPIDLTYEDVHPKYLSCFLPVGQSKEWDFAWAEFISYFVPHLISEGWDVTVEDSSQVEFHRITPETLTTSIVDLPDHGIDWFQFKASYITPDGSEASLLPVLSKIIEQYGIDHINEQLANLTGEESSIIEDEDTGCFISINSKQFLTLAKNIYELFGLESPETPLHTIQAADAAEEFQMDTTQTVRDLAQLGKNLKNITTLPRPKVPINLQAELRPYQLDGFHWLQFLSKHSLHGILADDMGLGKTLQTLAHIQAEVAEGRNNDKPSMVIAPTSVVGNWKAEAAKFTPDLNVVLFHGPDRKEMSDQLRNADLILTTYGLLVRDFDELELIDYHILALDEAQYIKNPAAKASKMACQLPANHRISLSGTPIENHLGELWAQMRFLMPGLLGSQKAFSKQFRTPIEKYKDADARNQLSRRISPLILRRTKDQVATELPPKTHILHTIPLNEPQIDVYETVRAVMDDRVRSAIDAKGLAKSHIIVLDALLKLRQICCHPKLLKLPAAQKIPNSAKLDFLTKELLPTLLEEGRKILLFSSFTSMLDLIEAHLVKQKIPFAKIVGSTLKRQDQVKRFQEGHAEIFLISLKAGGTGLNLTAADTVIHYDPWWNPAAENQATDRAHRIGQTKPVFVHKLISEGTIEQRIQELQEQKSALVDALLTADTTKLKIDTETLNNLLAPL